jgi:hypothetical protein
MLLVWEQYQDKLYIKYSGISGFCQIVFIRTMIIGLLQERMVEEDILNNPHLKTICVKRPNDLALSCLADCASLGPYYIPARRRVYRRKLQAEGQVSFSAGLGA